MSPTTVEIRKIYMRILENIHLDYSFSKCLRMSVCFLVSSFFESHVAFVAPEAVSDIAYDLSGKA